MDFNQKLQAFRKDVDDALNRMVPLDPATPSRLKEAMRYSVSAGGKRIRPVLLLGIYETAPSQLDPLPAAVALECLHTYSLIHDDLPSMDDSALRRGLPTCHKAFDEATAVLTGDALLTLSFEILSTAYCGQADTTVALITELSRAAGAAGMVGGQMQDIQLEAKPKEQVSIGQLQKMEDLKTGALFQASLRMGVILSGHPASKLPVASELGRIIGRSFQIMDDILDAVGDEATVGKSLNSDSRNAKVTAVDLYGMEGARSEVAQLIHQAQELLGEIGKSTCFLSELLRYLKNRCS